MNASDMIKKNLGSIKITTQVHKKPKAMTGVLRKLMVGFSILFVILGICIAQAFLLPAFCMAALYFAYDIFSQTDYEYVLEGDTFSIYLIRGKRYRSTKHVLDLDDLEVVADPWHASVAKYRIKEGTEKLPKYDYTSYEDEIPYYTMIISEGGKKIKLLLDLSPEMLHYLRRFFPGKVFVDISKIPV